MSLLVACGGGGGTGSSPANGLGTTGAASLADSAAAPASTGESAPTASTGSMVTTNRTAVKTSYEIDGSVIVNPERGLHSNTSLVTSKRWGAPASNQQMVSFRQKNQSLVRGILLLEDHRSGPLPDEVLTELRQSFAHARNNGLKIWLLGTYNFPDGAGGEQNTALNIDPPLEIVLAHLEQLRPVFAENRDVLAGLYNGFFGAWGEWHSSSTGLDKGAKRQQIYEKLLSVTPPERMITGRTFEALQSLASSPPTAQTAYDQSPASRTGMTNQCYLVNTTDAGTYTFGQEAAQRAQLALRTQFVPLVAETCDIPNVVGREDCVTARAENELLHLSVLNGEYYKPRLDKWKADGCYDEIASRLGYRLEMASSDLPTTAKVGETLPASFVVRNTGYAAPYNPRGLALVLRNTETKKTFWLGIRQTRSSTLDPRMWFRESGDITVSAQPLLPAGMPAGTYDVLLSLHDLEPSLQGRPEFSIRLANKEMWEPATGLNLLQRGVQITP